MKIIINGYVHCLKCAWEGSHTELTNENNGETKRCPDCRQILIDTSQGKFVMQFIKAETMKITS